MKNIMLKLNVFRHGISAAKNTEIDFLFSEFAILHKFVQMIDLVVLVKYDF